MGTLYPSVSLDIPCTLSSHSVSYLGQTLFLIKPLLLSTAVAAI
nr:MAG TPA: hypothetical protein [Caudoviricetes sp.]